MAAKPMQIKLDLHVRAGWTGAIAGILEILMRGTRDGRIPARPVVRFIVERALGDKVFLRMLARQDRQAAANRLYAIGQLMIAGGVSPVNAPSTAARKGGDRRALRRIRMRVRGKWVEGRDRVYKNFRTDPPAV